MTVIYLSGAVNETQKAHPRPDLGFMLQPGMGNKVNLSFVPWAADNGCFAQGDAFDPGKWLEWLASLRQFRKTCLFAVAPDVLGNAGATIDRAAEYLHTIRQLGFPPAFVAQDGLEALTSNHPALRRSSSGPKGGHIWWDEDFDVLFIGGTNKWKFSKWSQLLVGIAKAEGKRVHIGRVNSLVKLRYCAELGADSTDGTYVKFGPDRNLPHVYDWLDTVNKIQEVPHEAIEMATR